MGEGLRLIHRLILLRYSIPLDFALNDGPEPGGKMLPVAADLQRIMNAMKAEAYDFERGRVDYPRLGLSPTYAKYRQCALRLQSFDPATLSGREERLAFWINLYNALVVDAVIQFGVGRSVNEVSGFFWRAAYAVGWRRYSPFDIENGILRANAPHPAIPGPHFGAHDPRRRYSLERLDPRIHFALVCAARSCPPIAVYDSDRIDKQLDLAVRGFVNGGGVEVDRGRHEIRLSQIFRWYAADFGGRPLGWGDKRPLLKFISDYLGDDREYVAHASRPAVRFLPYDWTLNHVV